LRLQAFDSGKYRGLRATQRVCRRLKAALREYRVKAAQLVERELVHDQYFKLSLYKYESINKFRSSLLSAPSTDQ
jgi:hypothetical protein